MTTFRGGVLSHEVPDGRAGADISVTRQEIVAMTVAGERLALLVGECRLELGGASGRMWFCRRQDGELTLYSEAPGFADALKQVPQLRASVTELQQREASRRRRTLGLTLAGAMLLALLLVGAYFGLRAAGRKAVLALPESADEKLGEYAISAMDLGGPVRKDEPVLAPVQAIVARLSAHDGSEVDYHVQVVDADVTNAFALPGGEIVVYTGLLKAAPDANAVAAVLAHEMGHVLRRHGIQRIAQSVGVAAAAQVVVGDVSGVTALMIELMRTGALTSYGRDQEREADDVGLHILHDAGLPPESLAAVFRVLEKAHSDVPAQLAWLSSHPELRERIATVEAEARALEPTDLKPLNVDFAALRQAVGSPLKEDQESGDDGAAPSAYEPAGGG